MTEEIELQIEVSIDDGYPCDLYIAQMLYELDLSATFYVPAKNIEGLPTLARHELRQIFQLGHEIGGHTYNHRYLNTLTDIEAIEEIRTGIDYIQDVTSAKVTKFCLPGGKLPKNISVFENFAFEKIRTTKNMNFNSMGTFFDPSYQYYPHKSPVIIANAVKQFRFSRLKRAVQYCRIRGKNNLPNISNNINFYKNKEIVHIWCHSWELEKLGLIDHFLDHMKMLVKNENSYT